MATKKAVKKDRKVSEKEVKVAVTDVPKVIQAKIGEQVLTGEFRTFKSGSKGWYLGGKVYVGDTKCQVSCSVVIVGSKPPKAKEKKEKK